MLFCVVLGGVLHPLVIHWIWAPSGFLNYGGVNALFGSGMLDFAGGVAVHVNGNKNEQCVLFGFVFYFSKAVRRLLLPCLCLGIAIR
jgi:hypothetical protein